MEDKSFFYCTCTNTENSVIDKSIYEELSKINNGKLQRVFKKGQPLFWEGERPLGLFCINSGNVKIVKVESTGKEQIIKIMGRGDNPGYQALLADSVYSHSAIALNDVQTCLILKHSYLELEKDNFLLRDKLIQKMFLDYREAEELIKIISTKSAMERLSTILLKYSMPDEKGDIIVAISRADISNYTGIAKETTSRLLSVLRKDNIISLQRKNIKVLDTERLKDIVELYENSQPALYE